MDNCSVHTYVIEIVQMIEEVNSIARCWQQGIITYETSNLEPVFHTIKIGILW